jgi:hypothetical protein
MDAFLDLFGLKRRENPRVSVNWLVDIRVPGTDGFIGLTARDISIDGIRLEGNTPDALERILIQGKRVNMSIRVPGARQALEISAILKWGPLTKGRPSAGWSFTQIDRDVRQSIEAYIDAHPEDVLIEET